MSVDNAAFPSVTNTASVAGGNFDNVAANSSDGDPTTVNGADLSTSTKTVSDLNGGDAEPGDTLRYTITLTNTSAVAATAPSPSDVRRAWTPRRGSAIVTGSSAGSTASNSAWRRCETGCGDPRPNRPADEPGR